MSDAHYEEALAHLRKRYEDKEGIIHKHYNRISNVKRSPNIIHDLRRTLNTIETQLRQLSSLGENTESKFVVATVKKKFPESFILKLEENRDGEWTTVSLMHSIEKLVTAR